jgi:two-component system chemotaxis sensor kinase CheA
MQVRLIPVDAVLVRLPRLVRDLSSRLGKHVELELHGQETELDRSVVETLSDPLVHLVRNSLDHGIESPEERDAAGKPPTGRLEIEARQTGGDVVITIRDDGRGIDPQQVARKAAEQGLIDGDDVQDIDMAGAVELLFAPGFTTAAEASDVSGRGVGLDAVRTSVRQLGGEVYLHSEPGAGTTAEIHVPQSLAILSALLVETSGVPIAIPVDRVESTVRLFDHFVRAIAGRPTIFLRDGAVPLAYASQLFGRGQDRASRAVILRGSEGRIALAVERVIGRRALVTGALPAELAGLAGCAGVADLPEGGRALVVDCDSLAAQDRRAGLLRRAA